MMSNLKNKNIVIGITGCIAAYKILELIRFLVKANANVDVIMTKSATEFVTPLTISTLSKNKVHIDMFNNPYEYDINHISLADKADLFLIAPATANIIGKIANGIADDLLTTSVMATRAPVVIAPAMNVHMWENPIVQNNIAQLNDKGYVFINPDSGDLACGYQGLGRLPDINLIFDQLSLLLNVEGPLKGKKVLVTVGGTREYIDPVRFITNKSSGKMGIAIVQESVKLGADVTAISTVSMPDCRAEVVNVETTLEMQSALNLLFPQVDVLIMAAAVADYTVENYSDKKIKKKATETKKMLELVRNPDLIADMAKIKRQDQLVIGFAAETDDLINNAQEKLYSKKLDFIVANDVSRKDIGMGSDFNEVSFVYPDGSFEQLPRTTKAKVASRLLEIIIVKLSKNK